MTNLWSINCWVKSGVASKLVAVLISALVGVCQASELQPFSTDECSAFPEGTLFEQKLWRDCCVLHDIAYWAGGTYAQRLQADRELEECVRSQGEPAVGLLMKVGVRVGGSPFWPTTFRWGYGWPYPRFYGELSEDEKRLVELELKKIQSPMGRADEK